MEAEEYLSVLNEQQKEAVLHEGSPLLILAGAGSGKTRVITTKIAWLISQRHVLPSSILAVTFTKKAAREMQERAVALEPMSAYAQIRTFHSWGAYFLRLFYEQAGIDRNFTVYDDDDMVTLISSAVPSLTRQQAASYAHRISLAKDYCMLPDSPDLCKIESDSYFPEVYAAYENRLKETGNVDFGDLIMLPYLVLKNYPDIAAAVHAKYKVIMVDEYQDSNVAQFLLLQQLAGSVENSGTYVCVVGDDDQSIYKFRGAEIQNILSFQKQFPGTQLIRLEQNYRSTSQILACADSVVKNNDERLGKNLCAVRGEGKKPVLIFLPTQDEETEFCADLILQAYEKNVPFSSWAILYRTNAQSLGFETEFLHRKIPYTVVGSLKFYEREEIKDCLAWLAFLANPKDEIAFRRIINKPARGIGNTSQTKILETRSDGDTILSACKKVKLSKKASDGVSKFTELCEKLSEMLPDEKSKEVQTFVSEILDEGEKASEKSADKNDGEKKLSKFVEEIVKTSGLEEYHKSQDEVSGTQKMANLQELVNSAVLYPCTKKGLLEFLDHIELDRNIENENEKIENPDRVTLITLHNTKGLEFKRVIITGMEAGVFPWEDKKGIELEEERRLFYVGITRAQNELYFTSCSFRRMYGQTRYVSPSQFLMELGKDNINVLGQTPSGFSLNGKNGSGKKVKSELEERYAKGESVYHDDYGHGQIIETHSNEDGDYVITVSFENSGIKKFLPKYQSGSLMIEK